MPAAPSLVFRILDQAFNQGNLDNLDEPVSADVILPPAPLRPCASPTATLNNAA